MNLSMFRILLLLLLISACGGGGGGGGRGPLTTPTPVIDDPAPEPEPDTAWIDSISVAEANVYRTAEYNAQWGLEAIGAAKAYALLAKNDKAVGGQGVKIAIADSGARVAHNEIAGNIITADSYNYFYESANVDDAHGHGTHVASTAAGVKNGGGMHGVAYNSQIIVSDLFNDTTDVGDIAGALDGSSDKGAKVVNASVSYGTYTAYNGDTISTGTDTAIISTITDARANDVLFVFAAGNDADNAGNGQTDFQDPNYLIHQKPSKPALFANNPTLEGYVLAVGAVDENGDIADFSNNCTVAKDYCLVAPGVDIYAAFRGTNSTYQVLDGTSMAAPHVSGAAAVLRGAWPHLTAPQTAQILLLTADDLGVAGVDDVYGHGMLNLYEAVQGYGSEAIVFGASVSSKGYDLSSTSFLSDPIFGDALVSKVAPALKDAVFFDDFGRDYKASLGNKISYKTNARNTSFNVSQILLNEYETKNIPFSFSSSDGKSNTKINFKLKSYSKNKLKFQTADNSTIGQELENDRGFSFVETLSKKSSFGFAFNVDEITNSSSNILKEMQFLSLNSLNSNPFQNFVNQGSGSVSVNNSQKNFNQLFINHKILDEKIKIGFSHQASYLRNSSDIKNGSLQNQINDFNLGFKANKNSDISVSFGKLDEFDNNLLNSKALGAFESAQDVKTSYMKISMVQKLFSDISLIANFSQGSTKINGNEFGIFRDFSNIKSRAFAVGFVNKNIFGGNLGLIYNEPMRVYEGKVSIDAPIARDLAGNVTRYQDKISLKPVGKEQNLELFFAKSLGNFSRVSLNLIAIKDAGNIVRKNKDYFAIMNYGLAF